MSMKPFPGLEDYLVNDLPQMTTSTSFAVIPSKHNNHSRHMFSLLFPRTYRVSTHSVHKKPLAIMPNSCKEPCTLASLNGIRRPEWHNNFAPVDVICFDAKIQILEVEAVFRRCFPCLLDEYLTAYDTGTSKQHATCMYTFVIFMICYRRSQVQNNKDSAFNIR
uniref:CACTA en-spm transposon protein n=1 Tax=Steinernema glaseri TaxID=37863 RepID=A0A1I7XXS7_9BILA